MNTVIIGGDADMGMMEQMEGWVKEHPGATLKDAWKAGYLQCTDNWCGKDRKAGDKPALAIAFDYEEYKKLYNKFSKNGKQ